MYYRGMTKKQNHPWRPYGQLMNRAVRVRFPPEVDSVLRRMRRQFGISVSHLVRCGVQRMLADMIPGAVELIRDPQTDASVKIKFIDLVRACARADLSLHEPELADRLRKAHAKMLVERRRRKSSSSNLVVQQTVAVGGGVGG